MSTASVDVAPSAMAVTLSVHLGAVLRAGKTPYAWACGAVCCCRLGVPRHECTGPVEQAKVCITLVIPGSVDSADRLDLHNLLTISTALQ